LPLAAVLLAAVLLAAVLLAAPSSGALAPGALAPGAFALGALLLLGALPFEAAGACPQAELTRHSPPQAAKREDFPVRRIRQI